MADAIKLARKIHSSVTAHECQAPSRNVQDEVTNAEAGTCQQRCQFSDCTKTQMLLLECEACKGQFCIGHKQKETHQCPKLWTATDEARAEREAGVRNAEDLDRTALHSVSRPLHHVEPHSGSSESKPVSARSRATAARLTLMQAKMHAKPAGRVASSLSAEDRFVIRLSVSAELNPSSTDVAPFFVGKFWPLGKVLDFAQQHFAVKAPPSGTIIELYVDNIPK
ncbi:unnamed protein product [Echinostoma caproni]|uniref:AN1-type domain-containing protein n=1 Tax=Echinostoma caproni TaxID=27848 RepID=A0A183AP83_9TREM|nr:unnamed protein product [Echinostoma caproni]